LIAANHETFWFRGHGPEANPMRKNPTVVITIRVDVAACLFGIAAILRLFM
jgi:hypothetical protein